MARTFSTFVTYPLEVVRSRLYLRSGTKKGNKSSASPPASASAVEYRNMLDAFGKIARLDGPRGFYRGLCVTLVKTVPSSALTFFGFEMALRAFNVVT